ncbi:MAG: adenylate/guanylate cyclase domain-containing protein [Rhizomicrobium sp.]
MTASFFAGFSRLRQAGLTKLLGAAMVGAVCAALAVAAVGHLSFLANANQYVLDSETATLAPAQPQDPDIVIVAVTEDTLAQFPYRAPVDRQFLASLLSDLSGKKPRAIGVDFLLDQPTEPAKDAALKRAIADVKVPLRIAYTEAASLVSPQQRAYLQDFIPHGKRALVTLAEDQFDVVRWIYPGAKAQDGRYVMGFSRGLADAAGIKTSPELAPIAWRAAPGDGSPAFREFPAHAVKLLPDAWFRDKLVLIGSDITLVDRHRTPFMTVFSGGEGMLPGVVIQAHALAQLLHGYAAPATSWQADLVIAFVLALLGALLGLASLPVYLRAGAGLVLVVLFWAGSAALFHAGGPLAGPVAPALAFAMAFFVMEAASGSEARAQRKFIEGVFSHHVAREVVAQILSDPAKMTSLEGERRTMTFLFTDVANFTTMSEHVEAKELGRVMNTYFEAMTEIVQKHGGMVDKFIGDAVVAIFNAPIDLPEHGAAAVRCGLEMDRFASAFSDEQQAQAIPFGMTRIGIHTGVAMVGNFGSRTRHNYTATGDAVNTAARLEGLNKHFGTRIGVSGVTRELCGDIAFRPTASVVLKGKTKPIEVWEPLQDDDPRGDFISRYAGAYAMLKAQAQETLSVFEGLAREAPGDPCVAFHLSRIRQGVTGVTVVMTEK